MTWGVILILLFAGIYVGLRLHHGSRKTRRTTRRVRVEDGRRHPVRSAPAATTKDGFQGNLVMPQRDSCEAVQRLRGRTFPADRVIELPVNGCDRTSCGCHLHRIMGRRLSLRRAQSDRRTDVRFDLDRRTGRDRRKGADTWRSDA